VAGVRGTRLIFPARLIPEHCDREYHYARRTIGFTGLTVKCQLQVRYASDHVGFRTAVMTLTSQVASWSHLLQSANQRDPLQCLQAHGHGRVLNSLS
jgi:hypothetical protein